jgi:hypothetical protein
MHYGSAVHTASMNVAAIEWIPHSGLAVPRRRSAKSVFLLRGVVDREHVNIGTACNDFTVPSGPELITSRISTAFPMVDVARALLSLNA